MASNKDTFPPIINPDPFILIIIVTIGLIYYFTHTVTADWKWRLWHTQTLSIERHVEQWKTQGNDDLSKLNIQTLCVETDLPTDICGPNNDGAATNPFGGHWIVTGNRDHPTWLDITATLPDDINENNQITANVHIKKTVKLQP